MSATLIHHDLVSTTPEGRRRDRLEAVPADTSHGFSFATVRNRDTRGACAGVGPGKASAAAQVSTSNMRPGRRS